MWLFSKPHSKCHCIISVISATEGNNQIKFWHRIWKRSYDIRDYSSISMDDNLGKKSLFVSFVFKISTSVRLRTWIYTTVHLYMCN